MRLIVAVTFGERNQRMTDRLLAGSRLRFIHLLSIFTDGWRPYLSAILRTFGELYRPKRKSRGMLLHRCLSKSRERQKQKIWIYIDLYNRVVDHGNLKVNGRNITPAMARGLIDHRMSYQEYIRLLVYDDYKWREKLSEKAIKLNRKEMLGAVKSNRKKATVMQPGGLAA